MEENLNERMSKFGGKRKESFAGKSLAFNRGAKA